MRKIKLIKLSDDYFKGNHPNGIYEGYIKQGYMMNKPKIGELFWIHHSKTNPIFHTSEVIKKLNKNNIFKTENSTYKIEYLDQGE